MHGNRRLWLLLLVLSAVTGLTVFDAPRPFHIAVASSRNTHVSRFDRSPAIGNDANSQTLLALRPRKLDESPPQNAFVVKDWAPPPPPPPAPPPPPPPQAPPLPFQFLGQQSAGVQWVVFLGNHDHIYVVRVGDVIEGRYQIDAITPPSMTFTYLPLQQQQTLSIGPAQ